MITNGLLLVMVASISIDAFRALFQADMGTLTSENQAYLK